LLILYRNVLRQPLDRPDEALRARKPKRLPTVLTKEEALRVIGYVAGPCTLMAKLLYGTDLRLMECLRLRVKDIDFAQHQTPDLAKGYGSVYLPFALERKYPYAG
jgi:integrase